MCYFFTVPVRSLSRVRLCATPWTVAHQAPLSWDSPGKNTGVDCHALLQRIFSTQELNQVFFHSTRILYQMSYQGGPRTMLIQNKK